MAELIWFAYSCSYVALAVIVLFLGKLFFNLLTPYDLNEQLTKKDNPAIGIVFGGFLIGLGAILCAVFAGDAAETPSVELFIEEIGPVLLYGAVGFVCLFIARIINDKLVLERFNTRTEVVESRNCAVAVVVAATFIGSGLIIAGGISGSADMTSMLAAFVAGQIMLVVFARMYQMITSYDDQKELGTNQNVAAGIGFAGNLIAYSLILMRGVSVKQSEAAEWQWSDRGWQFLYYAIAGCLILLATRFITDRVFLPKDKISSEIVEDRNLNAGIIEAALAIAVGAVMVFCL